jgi:hypothetical protein
LTAASACIETTLNREGAKDAKEGGERRFELFVLSSPLPLFASFAVQREREAEGPKPLRVRMCRVV